MYSRMISSKWIVVAILFLIVAATLLLYQIRDEYGICMLLLAGGMLLYQSSFPAKWCLMDKVLLCITIFDVASCFYSDSFYLSFRPAAFSFFCWCAYVYSVRLFRNSEHVHLFLSGILYVSVIALFLALVSFAVFRSSVLSVGFTDVYHFRFLYRPLGYGCNIWAEVALVILGLSCLAKRFTFLFSLLSFTVILLTFSRGAYLSLIIYLFFFLFLVKDWLLRKKVFAAAVVSIVAVALSFQTEFEGSHKQATK